MSLCTINGMHCLVVVRDMAQRKSDGYKFILGFADDRHLRVQLERREQGVGMGIEQRV